MARELITPAEYEDRRRAMIANGISPITGQPAERVRDWEPCEGCGAEAGEECRPMCTGLAAYLDELEARQ